MLTNITGEAIRSQNTFSAAPSSTVREKKPRKRRIKLADRRLPDYTLGEELVNAITHGAGAAFGIFALVSCLIVSVGKADVWGIVGGAVYGASLILLYTMSSVYHSLPCNMGKKVMQVIDHCTIYFLISGTYTPVVFSSLRPYSPATAWTIFGVVWGCAVVGCVFTAIDLKKYAALSIVCYLGMGWSIIAAAKTAIAAVPGYGLHWIFVGGVLYTVGVIAYGLGRKIRYMHSVFHVFVLLGSITQYIGIIAYIL